MQSDKVTINASADAQLVKRSLLGDILNPKGFYVAECYDKDGNLKWRDTIHNLVPDAGARKLLDTILGNTAAGAVVMGLKGAGAAANTDTQASHAAWSEVGGVNAPAYSGNRPTPTFSAAASRTKQTSAAVSFTFTSGGTVAGCFINIGGLATKDDTTGTLFSAGDFTGGSKTVANTDVLNVTYSLAA